MSVGDAASEELWPFRHDRNRVGRLGQEPPELGMVPAEVLSGAVAMLADAASQAEHLPNELISRKLIEFCIWSRHATSFAPSRWLRAWQAA